MYFDVGSAYKFWVSYEKWQFNFIVLICNLWIPWEMRSKSFNFSNLVIQVESIDLQFHGCLTYAISWISLSPWHAHFHSTTPASTRVRSCLWLLLRITKWSWWSGIGYCRGLSISIIDNFLSYVAYNEPFLHWLKPSWAPHGLGGFTSSYILHTHVFKTYLLGGYLPCRRDYKVWYFSK